MSIERLKELLSESLGGSTKKGDCATCGRRGLEETEFRDELSKKEYGISGMCQKCQDEVFGDAEDGKGREKLPSTADPKKEVEEALADVPPDCDLELRLGVSTWGAYRVSDEIPTEDHEDDACSGDCHVIQLPYAAYVVADFDDSVDVQDVPRADVVVKTDRGSQWIYLSKEEARKDRDFLLKHADAQHMMFSRDRGFWQMRTHSKHSPYIRRHAIGLTPAGVELAAKWNALVETLETFNADTDHPELPLPPGAIAVQGPGYTYRCQPPQFEVFERHVGKSGTTWIIPPAGRKFRATDIHCRDEKDPRRSEGYGGRTLEFPLVDGSVCALQGPWHSNADSLFEDTGIDLREQHQTWVVVARRQEHRRHMARAYLDIVHVDPEPVEGHFDRGQHLAEKLADELCEPLTVYRESRGGASMGGYIPPKMNVTWPGLTVVFCAGHWFRSSPEPVRYKSSWQSGHQTVADVTKPQRVVLLFRDFDEREHRTYSDAASVTLRLVFDEDGNPTGLAVEKHPDQSLVGAAGTFREIYQALGCR